MRILLGPFRLPTNTRRTGKINVEVPSDCVNERPMKEFMKKTPAYIVPKAILSTVLYSPAPWKFASFVESSMAKTTKRIQVKRSKKILPTVILTKGPWHIPAAYAARQLRINDIELFVPLISQRDATLKIAEQEAFQVFGNDSPIEVYWALHHAKIKGLENSIVFKLTKDLCLATEVRILDLPTNRIR